MTKHNCSFLLVLAPLAVAVVIGIGGLRAQDAAEGTIKAGEFTFKFGKPWVQKPVTSSMRAGQLTYDHEDETLKDVDVVFYYFGPGQGGGIDANIQRWIGQFDGEPESKTDVVEMGGRKVTMLTASGTYMESSGGPFSGTKTPRPNYILLGAIVPSDQGAVFLKLYGPADSVEKVKAAFRELCGSPFAKAE